MNRKIIVSKEKMDLFNRGLSHLKKAFEKGNEKKGHDVAADNIFRKYINKYRDDTDGCCEAYNKLGEIYIHKGNHIRAITCLSYALKLNAMHTGALFNMAQAQVMVNQYTLAMDC
ncbi:MAG: tetratricopeptide repeat protein [Candidatus Margulisiibacteriota bacterium]